VSLTASDIATIRSASDHPADLRLGARSSGALLGIISCARASTFPNARPGGIPTPTRKFFAQRDLLTDHRRAARNVDGKVILYADQSRGSMHAPSPRPPAAAKACRVQHENGITPEPRIKRSCHDIIETDVSSEASSLMVLVPKSAPDRRHAYDFI